MASLAPGTLLHHYRVIRELNRGGTAVVYEGDDTRTGAKVALKVMSLKEGKSTVPVNSIKREIEYAAAMQHENIVRLLDYFSNEQQMIIVWEVINGPDLLDLLNECGGKLGEAQAAWYFWQLLQGVTYIHANNLCHRDLKPENCMIDRRTNQLKIIDFGLSKHQHSAVTLGVGTPDYMAPELLANGSLDTLYHRTTGRYDATATDVWAIGVLLFLLVSGQYAFEDPLQPQNVVATLSNIVRGRHKPLPRQLSQECVGLIKAMLAQDPAERITLQGITSHPWLRQHGYGGSTAGTPQPTASAIAPAPAPLSYAAAASLLAGDGGVCTAADMTGWVPGAGSGFAGVAQHGQQATQQAQQAHGPCSMELEDSTLDYMSAESSVVTPREPCHAEPTLSPPRPATGPATLTVEAVGIYALAAPSTPPASLSLPWAVQASLQPLSSVLGPLLATPPRIPSFSFAVNSPEMQPRPAPITPKLVLLSATSAQQVQHKKAGALLPPSAIAAVRPPAAMLSCRAPAVPVIVEDPPVVAFSHQLGSSQAPLVAPLSLECSPAAQQASKKARMAGMAGLCRFWFGGRGSSCGEAY